LKRKRLPNEIARVVLGFFLHCCQPGWARQRDCRDNNFGMGCSGEPPSLKYARTMVGRLAPLHKDRALGDTVGAFQRFH
jgi:hypothetical protein